MKSKPALILFVLLLAITGVWYFIYKIYIPTAIAKAITSKHELPAYIPQKIKTQVSKIKTPVNEGATTIVKTMHQSKITLEQILEAIDNVREDEANAMLDSLNSTEIRHANQVFNMAKRQFPVDFDVEVFRAPYNKNVNMKVINTCLAHINRHVKNQEIDFESARLIVKTILIQKEKEFNELLIENE